MLITYVLIAHLILAASVLAGFTYRYYLGFRRKSYPTTGRKSLLAGSVLLVISGVALAGIGKLPITSLCLESLGLITALLVIEFGLQKFTYILSNRDHQDT